MAYVITVAQQKGGAGKTMLVATLAAAWAVSWRVAVLDTDPQRSLTRWHALRPATQRPIRHSEVSGWRLAGELDRLRADHDIVLIDSPPQIETDAKLAIRSADLVLVPLQPSLPDLWAAEGTLKLAETERRLARVVLNRAQPGGALREQVMDLIATAGHPRFETVLGNRIGYANAFATGHGVTEAQPRSVAAQEVQALLAEIDRLRTA
jgi:chromosome partitioning protein